MGRASERKGPQPSSRTTFLVLSRHNVPPFCGAKTPAPAHCLCYAACRTGKSYFSVPCPTRRYYSSGLHAATALQYFPSQQGTVRVSNLCSVDLVEAASAELAQSTNKCEKTLAADALLQGDGKLNSILSVSVPR